MRRILGALVQRVMALVRAARGILAGIRLFMDPDRLRDVFQLDDALTRREVWDSFVELARKDERGARALRDRTRLGPLDLAGLRELPPGTLGRVYGDFLANRGLDPSSIPTYEATDDVSYVRAHLYETHDIWHVVTGFDTDVAGELGLQAFYSAQLPGALAPVLIAGGLAQALVFARGDWSNRLGAVARGWTLGKRALPFVGTDWKRLWSKPLDEVRAELGVTVDGGLLALGTAAATS